MTKIELENALCMVEKSTVHASLLPRGDRMTWFYRLEGAPAELSGWSMISHCSKREAMKSGESKKAYFIKALSYAISLNEDSTQ